MDQEACKDKLNLWAPYYIHHYWHRATSLAYRPSQPEVCTTPTPNQMNIIHYFLPKPVHYFLPKQAQVIFRPVLVINHIHPLLKYSRLEVRVTSHKGTNIPFLINSSSCVSLQTGAQYRGHGQNSPTRGEGLLDQWVLEQLCACVHVCIKKPLRSSL